MRQLITSAGAIFGSSRFAILPLQVQDRVNAIRSNESLTTQNKASRLVTLTQEINLRLTELEHKNVETERQIGEFRALMRRQGNQILGYTLERVTEVYKNFREGGTRYW